MTPRTPSPWRPARLFAGDDHARRVWRVLLLLLLVVITWLALAPHPPQEANLGWDKLNHMAAFTALAFAGALARTLCKRHLATLSATLMLFGAWIEIAQSFVPGRSADGQDLVADAVGIVLGLLILWGVNRAIRALGRPSGPRPIA
ncbi:VanZ family protein [Sphaerotilus hippei]|uniref:VanZ family protein n=1 Tax=Sphaerotilus hippei TaxID=744406 RepID=A0A318HBE4_9BURK|nr:VanZ family protein [Sphaerotilus hippei]PXW98039.1 VanZ family protein [Sphaerotilus hippei]